jgi:hypothetical protein
VAFQSGGGFQPVGFQAGGPTGESGSTALTEGNDLIAAAGGIVGTGSTSVLDGFDIVVATGFLGVSAIGAILEGADGSSGFGGSGTLASGAIIESADTIVALGGVSGATYIATGNPTEGRDSVTAAGSLVSSGAAVAGEAPDLVTGNIFLTANLVGAATEGNDSVSGTGIVLPVALLSGNIQEANDGFAGMLTAVIYGYAAITEGPDNAVIYTGFVANVYEPADQVAGIVSAYWNAAGAIAEAQDFAQGFGQIIGSPFVPGNIYWWVPYGPQPNLRPREILQKRTYDSHSFDCICTNLLDLGATVATVNSVTADQGGFTFGVTSTNPSTAFYEDGTVAVAGSVIQVQISGGTIPSYLSAIMCTVRIRFTDTQGNELEATVLINLTDTVTA